MVLEDRFTGDVPFSNCVNPATPRSVILANGMQLQTTNGIILKSNGKLANAQAFDSTDANGVSLNSAPVTVKRVNLGLNSTGAAGTGGYYDSSVGEGWNMTGNGVFGMTFQDGGNVLLTMCSSSTLGDGGIFPCGPLGSFTANDNTLDLGTVSHTWKQVFTHGISTFGTATGNITATGYTNINGTNVYVNVLGAAVAVTIKNNAGTAVATNTVVTGGTIIPLQVNGSVSAVGGLSGTWWVQ